MIVTAEGKNAGIFQISKVTGRFSLGKIEYFFQIGNTHFFVFKDEVQDPQPGFIRACFENLRTEGQIETF